MNLYLLRGVPGAGKSTLATTLAEASGGIAISSDDFMFADGGTYSPQRVLEVHEKARAAVEEQMRASRENIFVHNIFYKESFMHPYLELAKHYGYRTFSLIVENRHGNKSVHAVPEEKYAEYASKMEMRLTGDGVQQDPGLMCLTTATLASLEAAKIEQVLMQNQFNLQKSALALGVGRSTLYRKINEYGIAYQKRSYSRSRKTQART